MLFPRCWTGAVLLVMGLSMGGLQAQEASSEEELMRALEILRATRTGTPPAVTNAPKEATAPSEVDEHLLDALESVRQGRGTNSAPPAPVQPSAPPAPKPAPAVEPVVPPAAEPIAVEPPPPAPSAAPAATVAGTVQEQLKALLDQYRRDEITPAEYQRRRYAIQGLTLDAFERRRPVAAPAAMMEAPEAAAPAMAGAFEAALIPNGQLLVRLDMRAARQAPVYGTLQSLKETQATGGEVEQLGGFSPAQVAELTRELEKVGIKDEDVARVMVSAELGVLEQAAANPKAIKNMELVMAAELTKDLTLDQVRELIQLMAASAPEPRQVSFENDTLGSTPVLSVVPTLETEPELHFAVIGGKTVLMGWNRRSLSAALDRIKAPAKLDDAMTGAMKALGEGAQFELGFVMPGGVRKTLADLSAMGAMAEGGGEGGGEGMGMMGVLGMLKDIQFFACGMTLTDGLKLDLGVDLGAGGAAVQLKAVIDQSRDEMLNGLAEQLGTPVDQIRPETLSTAVDGNVLRISLDFDKALVETATRAVAEQ